LSKLGDYALNKILEKFGLIDATCETCKATKTSIVIPEGKLVLVHCDQCGHSGKVYIPSLEMLPIQPAHIQAGQAHVTAGGANIVADSANVITQSANIHTNGAAHYIGPTVGPASPIIDAQLVPEAPAQDGGALEREVARLRERVARLEERLNGKMDTPQR
jgi:hypothetical protein